MIALTSAVHVLLGLVGQVAPLADPVPEPSEVKPGWVAGVVVLSLCVATVLLWFSLRRHLGRIQVPREAAGGSHDDPAGRGDEGRPAGVEGTDRDVERPGGSLT